MNQELLQQAREAKQKAETEQALIDQLPELERQAQIESDRAKLMAGKAKAEKLFREAIEAHKQRDIAFEAQYSELKRAFKSLVVMMKADKRSYDSVWVAALSLGYYLGAEDDVFGLSAESQNAHAEQLMLDNDIQTAVLPPPKDFIDHLFNECLLAAMRTV